MLQLSFSEEAAEEGVEEKEEEDRDKKTNSHCKHET